VLLELQIGGTSLEGSGEECRMALAAKNLFFRGGMHIRGPAVVIGLGHSLRLGGS
jgi:hypothetical protein